MRQAVLMIRAICDPTNALPFGALSLKSAVVMETSTAINQTPFAASHLLDF